jgi:hypothetical protein
LDNQSFHTGEEPRFYYIIAVWGAEYVRLLTAFTLPTLLSAGNLPNLPNRGASQFLIVTTSEDRKRITDSPIFPLLAATMEVVFLPLDEGVEGDKYNMMNRAHQRAIKYVDGRGFCVFLGPDAVISDGMLRRLYDLARAGRRVVVGCGLRVNQDTLLPELAALPTYSASAPLPLPPRQLVAMTMRHLHGDILQHDVVSESFPEQPSLCLWKGPRGDGILVRSLNLHPYLFDCRLIPPGADLECGPIDWALVPRFVSDLNSFYVETDSDNFCIFGLTPSIVREYPAIRRGADAEALSVWLLKANYRFMNRASFAYAIKYHTKPLDDAWAKLEQTTREFALDVIDPGRAMREWTLLGYSLGGNGNATLSDEVYRDLFAKQFNKMLAGDVTGVSGKAALHVLGRKVLERLRGFRLFG